MKIYAAVNPRHQRVVNTDDLWWLDDAWNERTAEWFSADERHFVALVRGLRNVSHAGVTEFLPSAEWLADVCQRALNLEVVPAKGKVSPLDVAAAVANHTPKDYNVSATLVNASCLLAFLSPIKRSDFDLNVRHAVDYHIKYEQLTEAGDSIRRFGIGNWKIAPVLHGLSLNPALPKMTGAANPKTKLNLYRWMFARALRDAVKGDGAKVMLGALCRNYGASTEDLNFFLALLDKEKARWWTGVKREGKQNMSTRDFYSYGGALPKVKLDELYKAVGVHPNFISHPYVDELYNVPTGHLSKITRSAGEAATWGHDDNGYSQSRKDRILLETTPAIFLDRRNYQVERIAIEALLDGSKAGLLRKLSNRLGKSTQLPVNNAFPQIDYIGLHAPIMGAVFANIDKKYGSADIPLEWISDIL